MLRKLSVGFVSLVALAAVGCSQDNGSTPIPDRDDVEFSNVVHPILLRDCGFQACHGSQERFFRVYGPGRTRLPSTVSPLENQPGESGKPAIHGFEHDYTKQLALSMIDADDPENSLLLRKPLAVEAGGSAHEGVDKYGRNVYRTPGDAGYIELARWVFYMASTMAPGQPPAAGAAGSTAPAP